MRDFDFIKTKFEEKHGEINNYEYLEKYINFLVNYDLVEGTNYTEKHHILPRCHFPEFENDIWNSIELLYDDHKLVHLWIFKAINDRKYQRPLNWMLNQYKNSEEISNAAKRGWVKLKNNEEKYQKFCIHRSSVMKELSSEEQRRRANLFWKNITDEEYSEFSNKMKEYWTDEKKEQKSIDMIKFYENPQNIARKSEESKQVWESRSEEFKMKFRNKMAEVNMNEEKRKDAGEKIKNIWKTEEYLNKMKSRKHRDGNKLKLIDTEGNEFVFGTIKKFSETYNFTPHLIRKYRDKKIEISEIHLNESNIILKGCRIESVNNYG